MASWYEASDPVEQFLQEECAFDLVKTRYVRIRGNWCLYRETPTGHRMWKFNWSHRDRPPTLLDAIAAVRAQGIAVDEWISPSSRTAS